MNSLPLWIFGLLLNSLTGAQELKQFPENFVVAKRNNATPVTLTCGMKTDGAVEWRLDDKVMKDADFDNVKQDGQNLYFSEIDSPRLGQYSCWRGGEMLSLTYLLLEAEEEDEFDPYIHCWANSYDCKFSCKWTQSEWTRSEWASSEWTAVRLGLGHECREDGKSCHWVSNSNQLPDGGFQFELSHSLSPYAEESTMLEVTAEAIINLSIFKTTKRFYLRDIVQPDSPQIVRCQEVEENLNVTILPPPTWSKPHSFFRLEHEIEYELKDNGKTECSNSTVIPKRISRLRVHSRDPLVPSAWSQWTLWKNVRTGKKKLCKCKNTAKFCCPELPSGYMDDCEKREKKKRKKEAKGTS